MNYKTALFLFFAALLSFQSIAQVATIHFYRPKGMYLSSTACRISVNDTAKFTLTNGSYHTITTPAPSIDIITSLSNSGIKNLAVEKDKTYYIEINMEAPNGVKLVLKNEFAGKPAMERLQADEQAKEVNEGSLKHVKVTTVVPLPQPAENLATIYLFRPFNITGVTIMAKVTDGETLYEVKNKSSYVITTDKQELTFRTLNEGTNTSNTSVKLKLEKGKVYYLAVLRAGGAIVLSETKEGYARQEMKQ